MTSLQYDRACRLFQYCELLNYLEGSQSFYAWAELLAKGQAPMHGHIASGYLLAWWKHDPASPTTMQ